MRNDLVDQARAIRAATLTASASVTTDDGRLQISALYPPWSAGEHAKDDIYNATGQTWECFQTYDNAAYPDVRPGSAAWYTFNRPLHGRSPGTAREFVQPAGAHDMYHAGEYTIYAGSLYLCKQDTAYSPTDYPAAWEVTAT